MRQACASAAYAPLPPPPCHRHHRSWQAPAAEQMRPVLFAPTFRQLQLLRWPQPLPAQLLPRPQQRLRWRPLSPAFRTAAAAAGGLA